MTDAIRELFELLTKKEKSGSDYTGTVTRVDGKTAYVQFDGSGITDTPVALSIGAKAGDSVRVRVADGRAWLVGNDDAPPNDSSEVGYELALTNALIRQLTTEQINGENGWINLLLGTFNYGNKLIWNGRELTVVGVFTAGAGSKIGPWLIGSDRIYKSVVVNGYEYQPILHAPDTITGDTRAFTVAVRPVGGAWTYPFEVKYDGSLTATKGTIGPWALSSSGLSTTFFQLTENGVSEGTLLEFINKQDTTIATEMYAGMLSFKSNTESGVQFLSCSVIKDSGVKAGLIVLGNDSNYAVVNISGLDGSLYCSGAISENGTLLSNKYMGIQSANGFYGMTAAGANDVWIRTTTLGLIPYQSGGSGSLGTLYWPFSTIYGKTIYENGTALSSKYAASGHNHSGTYLPMSGGTLTGTLACKTTDGTSGRYVICSGDDTHRIGRIWLNSVTKLYIHGCANSTTYATYSAEVSASDIRLKKNIDDVEIKSALAVIDRIRLHAFDWKDTDAHQRIGVIADELEKLDPMLADGGGTDEDGNMNIKTVNTFYLQGYEVKAIQELHAEVRSLKAEIAELKEIIAVLMEGKK